MDSTYLEQNRPVFAVYALRHVQVTAHVTTTNRVLERQNGCSGARSVPGVTDLHLGWHRVNSTHERLWWQCDDGRDGV